MAGYRPDNLVRPSAVEEALQVLEKGQGDSKIVAGNTAIYSLAKYGGFDGVRTLVDISRLGLNYIEATTENGSSGIDVGAATTTSTIAESCSRFRRGGLDALFETASKVTPPQVSNVATIGGVLCSGIPFFDMPTTVLALGAELRIASPRGERKVGIDKHFLGYFETSVSYDELLVSVCFPYSKKKSAGSAFTKLGRVSADYAVVNATSYLELEDDGECSKIRIALGGVADTPVRWASAEELMTGKKLTPEWVAEKMNGKNLQVEFDPPPSVNAPSEYKKLIIPVLVRDVVTKSLKRAESK